MDASLQDMIALVTGGSRGIGRAICVELARRGAYVFVNFNSGKTEADTTVAKCKDAGGAAEAIGFSVSDSAAVTKAVEQVVASKGSLDILVNNAGVNRDGLLLRYGDADWQKILDTNLSGTFYATRAAARFMLKQRRGAIVNISSVVGESGNAGQSAYSASKAGILGFTKSTAKELASRGVRVNAICPGFIETEMTASHRANGGTVELEKQIPLGRIGKAEEVAKAAAFLASPDAAYITGAILDVNGGLYM